MVANVSQQRRLNKIAFVVHETEREGEIPSHYLVGVDDVTVSIRNDDPE